MTHQLSHPGEYGAGARGGPQLHVPHMYSQTFLNAVMPHDVTLVCQIKQLSHMLTQTRRDISERDAPVGQIDAPKPSTNDIVPQADNQIGHMILGPHLLMLLCHLPAWHSSTFPKGQTLARQLCGPQTAGADALRQVGCIMLRDI